MAKTSKKSVKNTTTKKTVGKKVEKLIIDETPKDEMEIALDAIEEGAKEVMNGDPSVIVPSEEIEEQLESEPIKEDDQDPPMEMLNDDASVLTKTDEIEVEAMKETFKEVTENKSRRLNGSPFTYSWNGQEIDYIL